MGQLANERAAPPAAALTARQAAAILGMQEKTVRRAALRGELPSFRLGGRVRIPRAAVERLLAGGSAAPPAHHPPPPAPDPGRPPAR